MVNVDIPAIRALGVTIEETVAPPMEQASAQVSAVRSIEHSNFTSVVPHLAVAYVAAVEFVEEQLKTKREHLGVIKDRLATTADNWQVAEDRSTIQER